MKPPSGQAVRAAWPRPGKVVITLIAANLIAYVLELLLLRGGAEWVRELWLSSSGVFDQGKVWQIVTYWWQHDPSHPTHLLFNMFWLWMFGAPLEKWWGTKRFITGYVVFGLGGSALTLLVGLLSRTEIFEPLLSGFWIKEHLGASGAVMGVTVAWGLVFANQTINFLFLGEMKGKTFLWITIAFELLVALSFSGTSSTSHFGGMAAAFILCKGLWRPSKLRELFKRFELERRKRKIESELRVIDGGKDAPKDQKGKTDWN
jgi:rhomboid family protein